MTTFKNSVLFSITMCGIIGYIGERQAFPLLVNGLERLEYRGYDSAGIAIVSPDRKKVELRKVVGRVARLDSSDASKTNKEGAAKKSDIPLKGTQGIGHTRWATHGKPTIENAHPHTGCTNDLIIAHNGIIENYLLLKAGIKRHSFSSTTDSEVIAHLIEDELAAIRKDGRVSDAEKRQGNKDALLKAVFNTAKKLYGTYGLCVLQREREELIAARNGSPLIIGLGRGENFIASDISAVVEHTKKVIYLDDFEIALVRKDSVEIYDKQMRRIEKKIVTIDWDVTVAEKQGFKHFMLKEINEQPEVIEHTLHVDIPEKFIKSAKGLRSIHLVACGTAWHSCLVGKYLLEKHCGIQCIVDTASEFRYRNPLIGKGDLFIAVSQSGETADTLAALRLAKKKGAMTLGIINVMNSTIAREADSVIYTRAGMEVGVASTKAFISQLTVLYLLAEKLSEKKIPGLRVIPALARKVLADSAPIIEKIAKKYFRVYNFIFIGRNINFPIALEGALKLKEISYIHAEGYSAGEMKHGPIALVTDEVPTVAIALQDSVYDKMINNIQEIRARNGKVIAIASENDKEIGRQCEDVIYLPAAEELLNPLLSVIPLQLLAYHIADDRDCDVDKPRNLAKSVTVE